MKSFKRLVGLLLCLSMVLSFVPATAVGAAESTGTSTQNTTTSDILERIDLTGTAVGGCSQNNAANIGDLQWWNETVTTWKKHETVVDGNASSFSEFNSDGASERADWYLNLSGNDDGYTAVDQLVLYAGCGTHSIAANTKVVFILNDSDTLWEETFSAGDWDADKTLTYTFDETINATGMYVWQVDNDYACLGEIELYQYVEVPYLETATLNGANLSDYVIVYDDTGLDYNRTAAEYIQKAILMKTGVNVPIVDDNTGERACEIIVGATDRDFSDTLSAPENRAMKFTIKAEGTKIAMEADYFIIAGAAYYFVETYINNVEISNNSFATTCTTNGAQEVTPITKPAKNYIMLIGDGMGVMQTRLWEKHGPSPKAEDDATYGYSDGENIFYGEYLPYKGFSQTANIYGKITDSAAGGTALATGYKTINGYVGRDQYENDIKNLSEVAWDMGKAVGIMSTEGSDGATPAAFSAHTSGRYDNEVISDQDVLEAQGYVFVERYRGPEDAYNAVFKTYTAEEFGRWDAKVKAGMSKLVKDPQGFFVMYEEAYIDKLCHALQEEGNPNATTTEDIFRAMYRFNQHIAYFMEFAMYNPDTFVLITADHETGGLNENWEPTQFNVAPETGNDHSLQDVPVYVYGHGGEIFDGVTAKNASIGRTFAHIMTNGNADDFGNPEFPIIEGYTGGDPVELPAPEGLKATATTDTSITVTANGVYGGTLKFRINGGEWQSSGIFTGLTASTTYTIEAMHDASAGYIDSDIATITVTTAEPAVKVELEPVPTNKLTNAMFGYYGQNISGDITPYYLTGKGPEYLIDGTISETRSDRYLYSDLSGTLENQQKVPVIYIELTEATVLGGVELNAWKYNEYNPEDFMVQITTDADNDNWKTVATVKNAFEGTGTSAVTPIKVEFGKTYTAYKVRILVDSITDMSGTVTPGNADYEELYYGGYIRVKEVTPLYDPSATPGQAPGDPTEPTTPPTQPTEAPTEKPTEKPTEAPTEKPTEAPTQPADPVTTLPVEEATLPTNRIDGAQFGYYVKDDIGGTIIAYYDNGDSVKYNESHLLDGDWDTQSRTDLFLHEELAGDIEEQAKVPVFLVDMNGPAVLTGIKIDTYEPNRYTMWNFVVQVSTTEGTDTWQTVSTQDNPFVDTDTLTITFEKPVKAYKVRILVDELKVLTADELLREEDPTDHANLSVGNYIRLRGITLNYDVNGDLKAPTGLTVTDTTDSSLTVTADPNPVGTLKFSIDGVNWQTSNVFTGLDRNTEYTIYAMYAGNSYYIDSPVVPTTGTTDKTVLSAPNPTVTGTTDSSITVQADTIAEGTLKFSIDGTNWKLADANGSYTFTGLKRDTEYTIQAKYFANEGYTDSTAASATATTAETQLNNPTGFTETNVTANSFTVKADAITGGTLKFRLAGGEWQTSGTFTGLTHGTTYTVEAMYVAADGYIDSNTTTIQVKTLTILDAPELTVTTVTDTGITVTAPAVTGGTLRFRINGGNWQDNGNFAGLKSNTTYTIEAMYVASAGYVDSTITSKTVVTEKAPVGADGEYAYLEAIREADVTAHVGYNRYSNHEMLSENLEQSALINDAMFGTISKIMGAEAVPADKLADGYRLLSIVYDLNNGTTKLGAIEITGGDYNLTKFVIQVRNTKGLWQTVKFVTNDLFDISEALRNKTVLIPFTPVEGTQVRLLIDGYEANNNNAPEIREMVIYEVKDNAQQEKKPATSTDAPAVVDGNKATVFTGNTATLTFNEATSVKRLKLFGNTESDSINGYTIKVQTAKGGEWTEVASGNAYSRAFNTSIVNLDKEYMAYGIQVIANGTVGIPEIEVYGYFETPEYEDPTPPTTPGATATVAPTRPPVVSPIQTSPAATEKFEIPGTPDWVETTPVVPNEGAWSDPTPVVPDETGTEPTAPVATQPEATQPKGWLDAIPNSQITPEVGYYKNGNYTTLTEVDNDDEALYLTDAYFSTAADVMGTSTSPDASKAKNKTLVPAAVLSWTGTKTIGGIEIVCKTASRYFKAFDIDVKKSNGEWENVKQITSNPFTSNGTVLFSFDPVECNAIRVRIYDFHDTKPQAQEMIVYEVKTENALVEIPLKNASVNLGDNGLAGSNGNAANAIDGDLQTLYQAHPNLVPYQITADLSTGSNIPTSVSRVKVYSYYPFTNGGLKEIKIELKVSGNWTQVYSGTAYQSASKDIFVLDLQQEYAATAIRVTVTSAHIPSSNKNPVGVAEIEVYGRGEGTISMGSGSGTTGSVGTTTVGDAEYEKIPLSPSNLLGVCSEGDSGVNYFSKGDFNNSNIKYEWKNPSVNYATKRNWSYWFDGDYTNSIAWGISNDERGDFLLDLSNGGSGTKINRVVVSKSSSADSAKAVPTKYTLILLLTDNTVVEKEIVTNWSVGGTANGTKVTYDFDQTYTVSKLYVWASNTSPSTGVCFGEFELQKKKDVQLDAPANLQATATTETSITVAANTLNPASAGTLKYQLKLNGVVKQAWTTNATFSGLTAGTEYTIEAMYDAAAGYIDSGISTITVTTATPVILEYDVSGKIPAGANIQLYKDTKPTSYTATIDASGNYTFSDVAIGNYYLVVTKAGHTTQMVQITVDKNVEKNFTLVSSYNVTGNVTAGAEVTLYQNGVAKQTVTATDGKYTFNNVAIGNYTLVFTKHSYETQQAQITVDKDLTVENVTLNYVTYTVSGTVNAGAEVTLYQNGVDKQTVTATDGSYNFSNLEVGNYVLVATMSGYISDSLSIAVDKNLEGQNITLDPVPFNRTNVVVDAVVSHSYNVRLYEPWALRVNVSFYTAKEGTALNVNDRNVINSYGAFAVIANRFGDGTTAPTSWEQIVSDPNAVQFRMAAGEGDCNMFPVDNTTLVFDYYDGLYTYRLAENVYWVAYYEDAEGTIHFTNVNAPILMDKVDNVLGKIANDVNKETQRIVLEHMKQLYSALRVFRGEDANLGNVYDQGVLNYGQNLKENTTVGAKYQFGKSHRIRLIEPWGIMINMQVRIDGATYDFADAQDYGLIFFHDKEGVYNGTMNRDQMLARNDVYIYSKSHKNAWLESWNTNGYLGITAAYDKDIFTYEMDSELYYVAFVVDAEGNYHYAPNASCMNLLDQMYAYYNNTTLSNKERATFRAMIELHESTTIHRKKYGK